VTAVAKCFSEQFLRMLNDCCPMGIHQFPTPIRHPTGAFPSESHTPGGAGGGGGGQALRTNRALELWPWCRRGFPKESEQRYRMGREVRKWLWTGAKVFGR